MIPKIIHQTWKTLDVPAKFRVSQDSWRDHHPDWTYIFWTDRDLSAFVEKTYPEVWSLFQRYPDQIQRVDAARYMILDHYGGIYCDLDIICLKAFDPLLVHIAFLPPAHPFGYSNDLMGAVPGAPIFRRAIAELPSARRRWQHGIVPRHFRVLLTAGSLFITKVARSEMNSTGFHVLSGSVYGIEGANDAYVRHIEGNSWAGWDTHALVFLHHSWERCRDYICKLLQRLR